MVRGVVNKDGSVSPIMKNILTASKYVDVNIRINVGPEYINDANRIANYVKEYGVAVKGLSRIHNNESEHQYITDANGLRIPINSYNCGSSENQAPIQRFEFARQEQELLLDYDDKDSLQALVGRLKPKAHFCSASRNSMFTIDPAGNISRCWHSAGSKSEAMGTVFDSIDVIDNSLIAHKWKKYSPISYKTCKFCRVLPLCMGGCSHPRLFMNAVKPPCEPIKYQINEIVNRVASYIDIQEDEKGKINDRKNI